MVRFLKDKGIVFLIVTFYFLCACSMSGGDRQTLIYYKPTFYRYDLAKKKYTKLASLEETQSRYTIYYHCLKNNSIVFVHNFTNIQIVDTNNGSQTSIYLDSLVIQDNLLSVSPLGDKITFTAQRKNANYSDGLYLLDLATRKIRVLRLSNNVQPDSENFRYSQPSFSNHGQVITYTQSHTYVNKDLVNHPWVDEHSIWTVDLSTNHHKKISQLSQGSGYPSFDKSDENIIFKTTDLLRVNLASGQVDTLDNSHPFHGYYEGNPPYLITTYGIFYTWVSKAEYPQEHEIYYYDAMSRKSTFLIKGFMPMSENSKNGQLLIRANSNIDDAGSALQIINRYGEIIETLQPGMRAIFSPDGEKIILLIFDISFIDG